MDKVRLGMIGSRFAARTHLANNFAKLRGWKVEVVGIASRSEASAQRAAEEFNIPSVYTDYRRLLERKDVDVIDLCTPTNLHEEMIIEAADAGKHIICEKPLTGYFGEEIEGEGIGYRVSRDVMLKGWGLVEIWPNLAILTGFIAALIVLSALMMRREVA